MTTSQTSRELARLGATPLAKIYIEVRSPYWAGFTKYYLENDEVEPGQDWFVKSLDSSQKISREKQTDDEDSIMAELLNGEYSDQIKEHLKEAPDGWLYQNHYDG